MRYSPAYNTISNIIESIYNKETEELKFNNDTNSQ